MTKKQQLWIEYYEAGQSPAEAAKSAGYSGSYTKMGQYNLAEYMKNQRSDSNSSSDTASPYDDLTVANVKEITAFWTSILREPSADLKDKLKVSELLAKVQGAFLRDADDDAATEQATEPHPLTLEEKWALIDEIRAGKVDASS